MESVAPNPAPSYDHKKAAADFTAAARSECSRDEDHASHGLCPGGNRPSEPTITLAPESDRRACCGMLKIQAHRPDCDGTVRSSRR